MKISNTIKKYGDEDCLGAYNLFVSTDDYRKVADAFEVTLRNAKHLVKAGEEISNENG